MSRNLTAQPLAAWPAAGLPNQPALFEPFNTTNLTNINPNLMPRNLTVNAAQPLAAWPAAGLSNQPALLNHSTQLTNQHN